MCVQSGLLRNGLVSPQCHLLLAMALGPPCLGENWDFPAYNAVLAEVGWEWGCSSCFINAENCGVVLGAKKTKSHGIPATKPPFCPLSSCWNSAWK